MATKALFQGLVVDEWDRPIEVTQVGGEAFYVYDDDGFQRHIESETVDRQVLLYLINMTKGHEDIITGETMRLLGQEDIFTKAVIEKSLDQAEENIGQVIESGLPVITAASFKPSSSWSTFSSRGIGRRSVRGSSSRRRRAI